MEAPKVILSEAEHRLLTDASIILTKNSVIHKVCSLFGKLGNDFRGKCDHLNILHSAIFELHPKVSKGEKYQELPWVMLDYPRTFDKTQGHFAIRCFCWWGNYFSIQLQVSGTYLPLFLEKLPDWEAKQPDAWYKGLTPDPWNMQLPNKEWKDLPTRETENIPVYINEMTYLKLAKKIPIGEWELLEEKLSNYFDSLLALIEMAIMPQSDEIVP